MVPETLLNSDFFFFVFLVLEEGVCDLDLSLQEVEMLSNSKAMKELTEEQQNLQKELECLQAEHAQRMEEFYFEQRDLEKKLDQVMKQKCSCDSNLEKDKEAEYAAQVRREGLFQTKHV